MPVPALHLQLQLQHRRTARGAVAEVQRAGEEESVMSLIY